MLFLFASPLSLSHSLSLSLFLLIFLFFFYFSSRRPIPYLTSNATLLSRPASTTSATRSPKRAPSSLSASAHLPHAFHDRDSLSELVFPSESRSASVNTQESGADTRSASTLRAPSSASSHPAHNLNLITNSIMPKSIPAHLMQGSSAEAHLFGAIGEEGEEEKEDVGEEESGVDVGGGKEREQIGQRGLGEQSRGRRHEKEQKEREEGGKKGRGEEVHLTGEGGNLAMQEKGETEGCKGETAGDRLVASSFPWFSCACLHQCPTYHSAPLLFPHSNIRAGHAPTTLLAANTIIGSSAEHPPSILHPSSIFVPLPSSPPSPAATEHHARKVINKFKKTSFPDFSLSLLSSLTGCHQGYGILLIEISQGHAISCV